MEQTGRVPFLEEEVPDSIQTKFQFSHKIESSKHVNILVQKLEMY